MPVNINNIEYSEEDKKKVLDFWNSRKVNPPSLSELVLHYTDGRIDDPRINPEGYIVRKILKDAKIKSKTKEWEKVEPVLLTEENKIFIKNSIKSGSRVIDIARDLFPSVKIAPLGREVREINKYLEEIGEKVIKPKIETITNDKYEPPRTFHAILAKVNEYLHEDLTTQNITAFEKKCLETTIQFLHSPRFIQEINNYNTVEKRISFESEFVRAVYEKPDLTPEEVSLTINWCSDIIQAADLKKQLEKLNELLDNVQEDRDGKISMSLVEAIGKVTTNLNEVLKRQERIYSILNTARSKRTEEKENKQANLAALFEWFREEENRKKMIMQAELLREERKKEIKRQESLDSTILLSLGLSVEEGEF